MTSYCRALLVICALFASQSANAQINRTITVQPGWNLLSLPVRVADSRKSVLFPTATSPAYSYINGYAQKDTIEVGPGFWLKFGASENIVLSGHTTYADTIFVNLGWNMIGSPSLEIPVKTLTSSPAGIVNSTYYSYTSGYVQADTLQPGKGYWIKATQGGSIYAAVTNVPCPGTPTVTYAGKTYHTVQIGNQCWLKENLDIGTMVDSLQNQTNNSIIEKYCYRNDTANCKTYGGFYQWNEAMQYSTTEGAQGICPGGWHIPTLAQLLTLDTTVSDDGNALKAVGQGTGSGVGTNTSGFSGLLSGERYYDGYFGRLDQFTGVWSSSQDNDTYADLMFLSYYNSVINIYNFFKESGLSIRCVED